MEAKRATRNLRGIDKKAFRIRYDVIKIAHVRPDLWPLTPKGRRQQEALRKRLNRLAARIRELLGAVEETEALVSEEME